MKRLILSIVLTLLLITAMLFLIPKRSTYKVGLIGCMTGPYGNMGISGRNGAFIAIEKFNKEGGLNSTEVELIVANNAGNIETAVTQTEWLLDTINSKVIFGHFLSRMEPAIPPFQERDMLFVSPLMATSKLSIKDDNFIRFNEPTNKQADRISELVMSKEEWEHIAIVYDERNAQYCKSIATAIQDALHTEDRFKISMTSYAKGKYEEFLKIATQIEESHPQVVILCLNGNDFALLAQMIKQKVKEIQLIGSRWASTMDMLSQGGRAVDGAIFTQYPKPDTTLVGYQEFASEYKKMFHTEPDFIARFSYEAVYNTLVTMREKRVKKPMDIRDAMLEQKEFQGLFSTIQMDSLGDSHRNLGLVIVEQGTFVPYSL